VVDVEQKRPRCFGPSGVWLDDDGQLENGFGQDGGEQQPPSGSPVDIRAVAHRNQHVEVTAGTPAAESRRPVHIAPDKRLPR
jgi:hypothetical protein